MLLSDRERDIAALKKKLSELQSHCERKDTDITNQDLDETEVIQSALRKMAEAVINDTEQNGIEGTLAEDGIMLQQPLSSYRSRSGYPTSRRKSPSRSLSPRYRSRSPALADATFSVVQAALGKRLRQVLFHVNEQTDHFPCISKVSYCNFSWEKLLSIAQYSYRVY